MNYETMKNDNNEYYNIEENIDCCCNCLVVIKIGCFV